MWRALGCRRGRRGLQRWRGLRRGCRRWRGDRRALGRGRGLWRALRRCRGLGQCRAIDHRERRADSHPFPWFHEQLLHDAGLEAFDVDGRVVGVHDGHHITSGHPLAGLDQPPNHGPEFISAPNDGITNSPTSAHHPPDCHHHVHRLGQRGLFEVPGVGARAAARAGGHPDHQRHADLPTRHVTQRRRVVEDLIQREQCGRWHSSP